MNANDLGWLLLTCAELEWLVLTQLWLWVLFAIGDLLWLILGICAPICDYLFEVFPLIMAHIATFCNHYGIHSPSTSWHSAMSINVYDCVLQYMINDFGHCHTRCMWQFWLAFFSTPQIAWVIWQPPSWACRTNNVLFCSHYIHDWLIMHAAMIGHQ